MLSATKVTRWGRAPASDATVSNMDEADERRVWVGMVLAKHVSNGLALPKDMVSLPDILHVKMINLSKEIIELTMNWPLTVHFSFNKVKGHK